jgi:N-acetylglucosamine kinase-like BadF-type ATPase
MILIADSGSTKTEWVAVEGGKVVATTKTLGINPVFQTVEEIQKDVAENVAPAFAGLTITELFFYGAGCLPEKIEGVRQALAHSFSAATISVQSDLVGAALAVCGSQPGIACILGTGSNTCFWDGEKIVKNVSPLGFILGDEGSGAVMGKTFVADVLKNQMPDRIAKKFMEQMNLTPAEVINRVYRQPFPNRFLATFTRFMNENKHEKEISDLITRNFILFFERNIKQYDYTSYPVNIIGSIGFHFREMLEAAAAPLGIKLGKVEQSPINGLIEYHSR